MREYIAQRVLNIAEYVIKTGCTVRTAAKIFNVSKSTVHKDLSERIFEVDPKMSVMIEQILKNNKDERHIRGGEATKNKYLNQRNASL